MKSAFLLLFLFPLGAPKFSNKNFFKGEFSQEDFLSNPSNNPCQGALQMLHSEMGRGRGIVWGAEGWEEWFELKDDLSCRLPDWWGCSAVGGEAGGRNQNMLQHLWSPWEIHCALVSFELPGSGAEQGQWWCQLPSVFWVALLQKDLHHSLWGKAAEPRSLAILYLSVIILLVPFLISNVTALVSQDLILNFSTEGNIKVVISATEHSQTQQTALGMASRNVCHELFSCHGKTCKEAFWNVNPVQYHQAC